MSIGVFYFLYGIIIGSFLNVCIFRIPANESIVTVPSNCPKCKTRIKPYDLIPIVSFIILGGKCRSCSEKISPVYPFIELLNGLLYLIIYAVYGFGLTSVTYCLFVSALLVLSAIDINHRIVPPQINLFILIIAVPLSIYQGWLGHAIGFFAVSLPLFIVALISKGGMGGGDVKLFAAAGALLGLKLVLTAFFITCLTASVFGIGLIIFNRNKNLKSQIPLVPFIALGCFASIMWGDALASWYLGLLYF